MVGIYQGVHTRDYTTLGIPPPYHAGLCTLPCYTSHRVNSLGSRMEKDLGRDPCFS